MGVVGDATLVWEAIRVEGCGMLPLLHGVWGEPCLLTEVGNLVGTGSRALNHTSSGALWAAAGGLLRVEGEVSRTVFLYLDGAMAVPLSRAHFYFSRLPAGLSRPETVHLVDPIALGAGMGVALRFR